MMISGKDGFFDKVRGRMAGTTGYITKPFGPGNVYEGRRILPQARSMILYYRNDRSRKQTIDYSGTADSKHPTSHPGKVHPLRGRGPRMPCSGGLGA